ncbi:long-chain-fatty-acid--CoA ligase [Flexivirga caeni]|uniref:Long-chain fatty acid--CoA ligase n=1 Tax=Flexivirga caeni TaxID=2294115 RepID=A0A3M9M3G9_9MICO|nr:long-chain fatty acid--CoA ligase [Flexivirga caeni]RNI19473.1 long-chain fatty acid--CoA ligase [Flexivirga caeni]
MTNLAENLVNTARAFPQHAALREGDRSLSYAEFDDAAARAGSWLAARGVRAGDSVGIMLPNVLEFPVLFYGAMRIGALAVPMNPLLKGREIAHFSGDSQMKVLCVAPAVSPEETARAVDGCQVVQIGSDFLDGLRAFDPAGFVDRADDDTAVILYTSGTTGVPKGAELTHHGLNENRRVAGQDLFHMTEQDIIMGCLPLFHVFGLTSALNVSVGSGSLLTLIPRFDPEVVLHTIQREKVTVFEGVPTMYTALAALDSASPESVATLRMSVSGGASLPAEVVRGFEAAYGVKILEGYGLSETSPVVSFNLMDNAKLGSIGLPIPGVEMKVVDAEGHDVATGEVGEICVRGPNVMKGYLNRPEATAEAIDAGHWLHTGDIGYSDEDGFYFIVDRKKDLIIRGGYNVYPREIEEVLYEHPAVHEAAVLGLPHPTHGEEVGAAVSLKPGATATPEEIRDFVKARVAAYKYPRRVWFLDDLPKTGTGKILKREITIPEPDDQ